MIELLERYKTRYSESQDEEMSIEDYLDLCKRDPGAYASAAWAPVRYVNRAYSRTALAGLYRTARAGLVTPLRDGMKPTRKHTSMVSQKVMHSGRRMSWKSKRDRLAAGSSTSPSVGDSGA